MLPDHEIAARLKAGDLTITPQPDLARLQPASVDVTLGDTYRQYQRGHTVSLADLTDGLTTTRRIGAYGLALYPGDFVLATTAERFEIPPDLCAFLHGRSTLGRLGVAIHITAGLVDPGFRGQVTCELANLGPLAVHLHPGDPIGQMTFTRLDSPAARPYGHTDLASRYQDQAGPTAPRAVPVAAAELAPIVELRPSAGG
jgi:dCTP deaminase